MKKVLLVLACLLAMPAFAQDYWDDYEYESYDTVDTARYDTYAGIRLHKNERIAFKYDIHDGGNSTIREDNFGFGLVAGNRLSDNVKIEFETMYTGGAKTKRATKYDFDVWANMLNVYLFREYSDAIAPYFGVGIGLASIWGDVHAPYGHLSDYVLDLSYQAMLGVNFALNNRVDVNVGVKYQYYGEVEHHMHHTEYAITDIDATEFYFGAVYKFGMK